MNSIDETLADRGKQYGEFATLAAVSQELKKGMVQHANWNRLRSDQKEALQMIQHKIARIINGDPNLLDSWHDISGYATLVANRLESEK